MTSNRWKKALWGVFLGLLTLGLVLGYRRFMGALGGGTLQFHYHGELLEILHPNLILVAFALPILLGVLGYSLADLPWPQRVASVLLRFAFLMTLALALGRLARTTSTSKVCTVFLVDVSQSVPIEALGDAREAIQQAMDKKPSDDLVKIVTFARAPRLLELPEGETKVPPIVRQDEPGAPVVAGAGTNLQSAMQLAYGLFSPGYLKRIVLFSDGLQTHGDALAEASRAQELGARVSVIPYHRPVPGEVAVQELKMPPKVHVGDAFEIHAMVYSSRKNQAKAKLYQGEALNGLDGLRDLDLQPGQNDVVFKSIVRVAGEVTYSFELFDIKDDTFKENNRIAATIDVPGRPTVLYVEGSPANASYLASALTAQQYDVDVRPPTAFPSSLKELERYDMVILSDTPAEHFGPDAQALVEQYVSQLGGGFLYVGGENGFSLGGWMNTPMEKILPVKMDPEQQKDMPSVALCLVIDRSGSMTGTPVEMAKAAARAASDVLQPDDLVEVIAFDTTPIRYVKMTPARRKAKIEGDIAKIEPGGGTDIYPALDAAYQDLSVVQARKKHVILLTDGQAPTNGIRDVAQAMAAESITVTTVGLGGDVDDALLMMIKDIGGGRYYKVPDPQSLPKIFTKETEDVSRQAAQEDWFPVHQVAPANFLSGVDIGGAPYLHGYVSTKMKPAPAQEILESDKGEPILARWHVGLGWSLAWTSDLKNRWAVEWLRWPGYGTFLGQLIREHMRTKHRRELDMHTENLGGEIHAYIDAFDAEERFQNGLDSTLTLTGPIPSDKKQSFPMQQTAPGRYEASFPLTQYGSFLLQADHRLPGEDGQKRSVAVSYGHISNPYPVEYARFEPDLDLLKQIAATTHGKVDPTAPEVFDALGESISFHEDLWPRALLAAFPFFLLDLLMRRVRLFDRKSIATAGPRSRKA